MQYNACAIRVLYVEKHLGSDLLSVIWSSGVPILEGLQMCESLGESNRDTKICPLSTIEGCLLSGFHCRGFYLYLRYKLYTISIFI